jgi:tRNA (guanine26-N2/guanine27-N2)-dimethyltransferase
LKLQDISGPVDPGIINRLSDFSSSGPGRTLKPVIFSLRRQRHSVLCQINTGKQIHSSHSLHQQSPAMAACTPSTEDFSQVSEGKATILFPKDHVFYNPVQQFNRDLSVAVIRTWGESPQTKKQLRQAAYQERHSQTPIELKATNEPGDTENPKTEGRKVTILEALSASGLRAIRFALEISNAKTVYANDMSPDAVEAINRNIAHNNLPAGKMSVSCSDANALMYAHQTKRVDVIDLDPYGTAAPFIDAAIQALASDALLCVTCTDMSVLAGPAYPEKCFANYGGIPAKQEYTHEVVLQRPPPTNGL